MKQFTEYLRVNEKSPATVEKYRREVREFLSWLGDRKLTAEALRDYKEALIEKRAPAGVNGAVAALNAWLDFLGKPEYRLKAVKVQRKIFRDETKELNQNEYRRLLAAAERRGNDRLMLVMQTICATGIRVSELRFITAEAARLGRAEVRNKGKSRTVFLPVKLQKLLLKYARAKKIAAGPIFITRNGKPLDRSNIWHDMKRLCQEANVAEGKVFPHNLRHLFARTFYGLEKDIVRLADILGHSSINTTRIYTMESGFEHRRQLDRMKLVI